MKVGALTIGQAPRGDVAGEFLAAAGPGIELLQAGALDGLSDSAIASLAPAAEGGGLVGPAGEALRPERGCLLVTRLLDGREVRLDEAKILGLMRAGIGRLEEAGASLIALFCTGRFPGLGSSVPLLRPDRLLVHFVAAVLPQEKPGRRPRLLALVPAAGQEEEVKAKWAAAGLAVETEVLSPYSSTPEEQAAAADRLSARGPDLVVLDCIGYGQALKDLIQRRCKAPVVLPRTLLARAAAELAR